MNIIVNNMNHSSVKVSKDDDGNTVITIEDSQERQIYDKVARPWTLDEFLASMDNPNSDVSKSISRSLKAPRRRYAWQ